MYFDSKIILLFFVSSSIFLYSSNQPNQSWKLTFFNGYMQAYDDLESPKVGDSLKHHEIVDILQKSFNHAVNFAQEKDSEIIERVRSQVDFFAGLSDAEKIEEEMKKCESGMKKAKSWFARMATPQYKAECFVKAFCDEAQKRIAQ
ncbi:hypothetical protein HYV11_01305 [Candidatus Dependentiae bacterium]|nr:hypothetical protein [Candidatus Dependentiae bacterium]